MGKTWIFKGALALVDTFFSPGSVVAQVRTQCA